MWSTSASWAGHRWLGRRTEGLPHVAFQHVGHQAVGGAAQRGQLLQQVHAFGAGLDRALQRLGLALDAAQG
jgi:hypothetical protein